MSYKRVGGLHFVKLGCFGFSFWVKQGTIDRICSALPSGEAIALSSLAHALFILGGIAL